MKVLKKNPFADVNDLFAKIIQDNIIYFPVRHHSPACSWHLRNLIQKEKFNSILIEGPHNVTNMIPDIIHQDTKPPIAVYMDCTMPTKQSNEPERYAAYYPFCEYSPEYIALKEGTELKADIKFIDLDYKEKIKARENREKNGFLAESLLDEWYFRRNSYTEMLCKKTGCRDQNELWDHMFEANYQSKDTFQFIKELACYCFFIRKGTPIKEIEFEGNPDRERIMAYFIKEEIIKNQNKILVVTGGFHTVVLPDLVEKISEKDISLHKSEKESTAYLIPYSYDRLDRLNGYSAGMPAPKYYHILWKNLHNSNLKDPYYTTANEIIVEIAQGLRKERLSYFISSSDEIGALNHAKLLAELRGHSGITREDILDGMRSSFVKGSMDSEGSIIQSYIYQELAGYNIGSIPKSTRTLPLTNDFYKTADSLKIHANVSFKKNIALDIYRSKKHREISRFFHQLVFLDIPFPRYMGGPDFVKGFNTDRIIEHWEYSWSPQIESSLIDNAVYGSSMHEASLNKLKNKLKILDLGTDARNSAAAVEYLIIACRMGLQNKVMNLIDSIKKYIQQDSFFSGLVTALKSLIFLKTAREALDAQDLIELDELILLSYDRACYLSYELWSYPNDDINALLDALCSMREIIELSKGLNIDDELFYTACKNLWMRIDCNPVVKGGIGGLLYHKGWIEEDDILKQGRGYLEGSLENDAKKIDFIRGILFTNREIAWQSYKFINFIDELLKEWDEEYFLKILPEFRLAFSNLTPKETDKVAEVVAKINNQDKLISYMEYEIDEKEFLLNTRITEEVLKSLKKDGIL